VLLRTLKRMANFPRWSARTGWAVGVTALVAGLAAYSSRALYLGPEIPAYAVKRAPIVQTVVASGRIVNPLRIEIASQLTGTVAAVPVREGETVTAGQILVRLESKALEAQVEQQRFAVAQAEGRVRQVQDVQLRTAEQSLREREATLLNAQRAFERTRDLFDKGFVGRAQLDDAERGLEVATSQVRAARLAVQDARPDGPASQVAAAALEQARAALRTSLANLETATLRAPTPGTLIGRAVERGDVATAGRTLMVLSPAGPTQIIVQIDERNLGLVAIGQRALASPDAYPDRRFGARVEYINPAVDPQRGAVETKLGVPDPPGYLRQDMTISVDIEVGRRDDTLVLPTDAVHDAGGRQPWVLVANAGYARRTPVALGLRGSGRVEILEGLSAGDLALSGTRAVAPGARVRAQPVDR